LRGRSGDAGARLLVCERMSIRSLADHARRTLDEEQHQRVLHCDFEGLRNRERLSRFERSLGLDLDGEGGA
jgi:hypothetical protein